MVSKSLSLVAAAALAFCAVSAQAAANGNGFANGGFERGPGPAPEFAFGWEAAPTGNPAMWSTEARTGSHSALVTVPNGFGGSTMYQNSVANGDKAPLDPANIGFAPTLSFWAKGDVSPTGNVLFSLRYLAADGGILTNNGNVFFQDKINTSTWSEITFQGAAIPAGTVAVFLEINTAVGPLLDGRSNAVYIDDLSLGVTAVPEPSTYAMLLAGLVGVGAVARRRRSV